MLTIPNYVLTIFSMIYAIKAASINTFKVSELSSAYRILRVKIYLMGKGRKPLYRVVSMLLEHKHQALRSGISWLSSLTIVSLNASLRFFKRWSSKELLCLL